jgi:hypothetical protein
MLWKIAYMGLIIYVVVGFAILIIHNEHHEMGLVYPPVPHVVMGWENVRPNVPALLVIHCPDDAVLRFSKHKAISVSELYDTWETTRNLRKFICMALLEPFLSEKGLTELIADYEMNEGLTKGVEDADPNQGEVFEFYPVE